MSPLIFLSLISLWTSEPPVSVRTNCHMLQVVGRRVGYRPCQTPSALVFVYKPGGGGGGVHVFLDDYK